MQRKLFIQLWSEKSKWTFVSKVGWQLILSSQEQFHVASKPCASSIYHFFVVVCREKHLRLTAFKTSRMKIISPLFILICGVGKKKITKANKLPVHSSWMLRGLMSAIKTDSLWQKNPPSSFWGIAIFHLWIQTTETKEVLRQV